MTSVSDRVELYETRTIARLTRSFGRKPWRPGNAILPQLLPPRPGVTLEKLKIALGYRDAEKIADTFAFAIQQTNRLIEQGELKNWLAGVPLISSFTYALQRAVVTLLPDHTTKIPTTSNDPLWASTFAKLRDFLREYAPAFVTPLPPVIAPIDLTEEECTDAASRMRQAMQSRETDTYFDILMEVQGRIRDMHLTTEQRRRWKRVPLDAMGVKPKP